jgi:hypothetical protein
MDAEVRAAPNYGMPSGPGENSQHFGRAEKVPGF